MNYQELQKAKETFNLTEVIKTEKVHEVLTKKFVKYFNRKLIAAMTIDAYIVGISIRSV